MLLHLLILLAGIMLGFNFGIIVYACLLAAHRRTSSIPPAPAMIETNAFFHLIGIRPFPEGQCIAAALRLQ
jgi:hypothetical protein